MSELVIILLIILFIISMSWLIKKDEDLAQTLEGYDGRGSMNNEQPATSARGSDYTRYTHSMQYPTREPHWQTGNLAFYNPFKFMYPTYPFSDDPMRFGNRYLAYY